jgi:hypothetical protein
MNSRHAFKSCLVAALVTLGTNIGLDNVFAAQRGPPGAEEGVQVLTRGPVHEAFAETVTFDPQPGIVVAKAPRNAIEELPPDQRPEGTNVAWIPGYWAWDDERDDFLWVSGIWRALPPGRQWVPGYWAESESGVQWISGYWADAKLNEVRYLPEPPATVEVGPNIAAPSADHNWLPGCWLWHQDRYAWRPGYWAQVQPDWDWVPAHYVWSPRGYVFVDGYYDYSVARRGVLFAPVYFDASIYSRRGYSYSPSIVIDLGLFTAHLFSRPSYHHYYFGDYYASNYNDAGYYPWFSYSSSGHGYDPFYAHQRWHNRRDRDWERRVATDFRHRRDHEDARPPRTLAAQIERSASAVTSTDKSFAVALPLAQLAKSQDSPQRFQAMDKDERQKLGQRGHEIQKFRQERQKLETKSVVASAIDPAKSAEPVKVKLPTSPIVAKAAETLGKDLALPKTPDAPKLDLKVEPMPKIARRSEGTPRVTKVEPKLPNVETKPVVPKAEPKPLPKVEKPNPRPGVPGLPKPEPKVEPKPTPNVEPKPAPKKVGPKLPKIETQPAVPKDEPKPAPRVPKEEPKPTPKVGPKLPKAETQPAVPKDEPRPAPRVPKVEPQPVPKVEPKAPKVETQPVVPKVESKPAPKVEPKPTPKVEPKPAPKVEPKPEPPKTQPKDKPKVEDKDKPKK